MKCNLWINGKNNSYGNELVDVISPITEEVIGSVELFNPKDLDEVLTDISKVQKEWAKLPIRQRAEVFYKFIQLLDENKKELAEIVHSENGKTLEESYAAVSKAIELCETATSFPAMAMGNTEVVSTGIIAKERIEPVGIVASITPFNFPLMVPMWTIPNSLVLGNALVLKPSTQTPLTMFVVADLLKKAGLPDGLFTVLPGDRKLVQELTSNKRISAVTSVTSTDVAKIIYKNSASNLKRCLSLGGAKNFLIVSPETDSDVIVKDIASSAFGMTGERCMAVSVLVVVGDNPDLIDKLVDEAKSYTVGKDIGPVISKDSRTALHEELDNTKGKVLLDGRDFDMPEKGYYLGPSIIKYSSEDEMNKEEIFGPILEVMHVDTIEEALELQNNSEYGNGASIFTDTGEVAQICEEKLTAGMVGINIGIPVPRDPFGFAGFKMSRFGYGEITGKSAINFFTNTKKVTTKWNHQHKIDWMS